MTRVLDEIMRLDPVRDHQRIVLLTACYEFPWDTTRSLELALFRTFAVPSVGELLGHTGEFERRTEKRYDDTDLILNEILEHGYDSDRGRAALRRMNQLHGRFGITNDDFLYVLSTFIFEPIRWNRRFGWRPLTEQERLASFYFWREIGRRMNIKAIPDDMDAYDHWNQTYERERFGYSEAGRRVADATMAFFVRKMLPAPLRPLGLPAMYAILDEPLLKAFRFPEPSPAVRALVEGALCQRRRVLRFLPRRRHPVLRTRIKRSTYPHGYQIEQLGPE